MTFTFKDAKIQKDESGLWLCFRINEISPARAFVLNIKNRLYDLVVKEHREKRSLDANAYCWALIDRLAEETGCPKTDIYRRAIREIGGVSDTVCVIEKAADRLESVWHKNGVGWFSERAESKLSGCVTVTLYYGSSQYDTKQMSRLIDHIVEDCKALGIETLPPDKLDLLKEEWSCTK